MVLRRSYYTDLMPDLHRHVSPCLPYRRHADFTLQQYEDQLVEEYRAMIDAQTIEIESFIAKHVVGQALGAAVMTGGHL